MTHRTTLVTLVPMVLLALSTCTAAEDAPAGPTQLAQESVQGTGQVVTEIDQRIWRIHQDRRGEYWFGSNGTGVYRYDGQRMIRYDRADGLGGDQVRDIQEDNDGNVFVATNDAIARFDGTSFTTLELGGAPADGSAWVLDPDDVWLVFNPGRYGPCRYDGKRLYQMTLPPSPAEDELSRLPGRRFTAIGVYSIYRDQRGHLWFGTADVGVCRYDGEGLSWLYEERLTTTPSGGAFGIRSVYQDNAGDYWICNTRQRFKISPEVTLDGGHRLVEYERSPGLPDAQSDTAPNFDYFPSITEDRDGAIWMACGSAGVWKYDGDDVTKYTIGNGSSYSIDIFCDREGQLWVGTLEQGIHTFDGEAFKQFVPADAGKEPAGRTPTSRGDDGWDEVLEVDSAATGEFLDSVQTSHVPS